MGSIRRARMEFLEQITEQYINKLRETTREAKSICRRKKRLELERKMKEIEENYI
jgi:hypothetical protein